MPRADADFIVIGAGSAGCVVAAELTRLQAGSVLVLEAGPSERHPLVNMPFGLVWLMGSKRDWRYQTVPQAALNDRQIPVPRGRMVGGSGSINSMVWFRGTAADFDGWGLEDWRWDRVKPLFEALENRLQPARLQGAHPLSENLGAVFGSIDPAPERESAGVFRYNLRQGRRVSAARGFLRPAMRGALRLRSGVEVDRIGFQGDDAREVYLVGGEVLRANKGVILSAGSIGSPAILMRSGIGPAADLAALGIDPRVASEDVGQNLQDHPSVGLHFGGAGYGLTLAQAPAWAVAPFRYAFVRRGRFASPTVEAGMFFSASGQSERPDVQCHFIPFMLGWQGRRYVRGAGFMADVCLCRPQSHGALRLQSSDPKAAPLIDPGLLSAQGDLEVMVQGVRRLRELLQRVDQGNELFPGNTVQDDAALRDFVRARCATAYHPVGTLRMGEGAAPVSPRLAVKGVRGLWVADASVMPNITSANTNAPSMMIGMKAGAMIAEDAA